MPDLKNRGPRPAGKQDDVPGKRTQVRTIVYQNYYKHRSDNNPPEQQPPAGPIPEPKTAELALIAASLRTGQSQKWSEMASHALDLWDACAKETQERRDRRRCPFLELCATLPSPKQYPAPLEEFLKLMLPKRRRDGREKSYRHFLIDWKKVDLGDAGDLLARHKQAPADKHEFKRRALLFETWFKVDLRRNRRLANLISRKSSPKAIKAEEKAADEERRQAVAAAEDRWNSACAHFIRRMVL